MVDLGTISLLSASQCCYIDFYCTTPMTMYDEERDANTSQSTPICEYKYI